MSAPAPLTVKMPPWYEALPASRVSPTSRFAQKRGNAMGLDPSVMATLSNVDVFSIDGSWLVTTRPAWRDPSPAYISAKFGSVLPSQLHCRPSVGTNPLIVVAPDHASFNQTGICWDPPARNVVDCPSLDRVMNSISPVGRTSRMTWASDHPPRPPRRMSIPALANGFVFCTPVTRATICPIRGSGWGA